MTTFAAWLQDEFAARGWDQRSAAINIGVRETAVHAWLRKGVIPQTKSMLKMAVALNTPVEDVMRQAGIVVPNHMTSDMVAHEEAELFAQNPDYRDVIRMIAKKPLDQQKTYINVIKRLLADE